MDISSKNAPSMFLTKRGTKRVVNIRTASLNQQEKEDKEDGSSQPK
jgi:hypothetical protein